MSEIPTFDPPKPLFAKAAVGATSPLWGYYASAAMGGIALWWMARFARPPAFEGILPLVSLPTPEPSPEPAEVVGQPDVPFVPTAEALTSEASGAAKAEATAELTPA